MTTLLTAAPYCSSTGPAPATSPASSRAEAEINRKVQRVLRFPDQQLDIGDLRRFSERFGQIQGPSAATDDAAHVGVLSNLKEDGKYIGSPDAGQDWHTDMSYRDVMGFVNVLYGIRIPRRNGVPFGVSRLIGSYATVARLLDEMSEIGGLAGVMLTFDDFVIGVEQFGQRIQPLMRSRRNLAVAA